MPNLTVWKFDDVNGAEEAFVTLTDLQEQGLIQIHDGAVHTIFSSAEEAKLREVFEAPVATTSCDLAATRLCRGEAGRCGRGRGPSPSVGAGAGVRSGERCG